jgi:NAD(P)H dehydrogenase (quinone)
MTRMTIALSCTLVIFFCRGSVYRAAAQENARPASVKVLVVYHSEQGHTAALAKGVEEGVKRVPQAGVSLKSAEAVTCDELLAADAVIVGSPVYWGNMSGVVKTFFDRWSTDCHVLPPTFAMKDKVGAAFVTGGEVSSGKEVTLLTILAAMLGNRMIVVSEGQALGATATTGEGKAPLTPSELDEGRRLGERVARLTQLIKKGRQSATKAK